MARGRVDEDLVTPAKTWVEPGAERLATGRSGGVAGAIGRVGAVPNALDQSRDHDHEAGGADPQAGDRPGAALEPDQCDAGNQQREPEEQDHDPRGPEPAG